MRWPAAFIVLVALAGTAEAYPQFQLSTFNVRCNQCHFAPAGGGLINSYGRSESADTISNGGNGALLHGLWDPPDWLALGGDFRAVGMVNDVSNEEGAELLGFPMQGDLYTRFQVSSVSLNLTLGAAARAREQDVPVATNFASREHYLMWQPENQGPYARVGRFYAPFGLRLVEHPSYTRRYMGLHTFEETYGASGGYITNEWEVHATAFTQLVRSSGPLGTGGAVYYERRILDDAAVWGGQARVSFGDASNLFTVGGVGKYWWEDGEILFMAELDLSREQFPDAGGEGRNQMLSHLSATYAPLEGWMFMGSWERFDPDLAIKGLSRDAFTLQAHWFPMAHIELLLYARTQLLGFGSGGDTANAAMFQIHYYL